MAVGTMALIVALVAQQLGYVLLTRAACILARTGMALIAGGTLVMTVMYAAMGFTPWAPPTLFVSGKGGANGIAGDDIVTGILILGGGMLVVAAFAVVHSGKASALLQHPVPLATVWAWVPSFAPAMPSSLRTIRPFDR